MSGQRNWLIDVLRGFSILIVMMVHGAKILPDILLNKTMHKIIANGCYGVTIFFVISGFLITTNSLNRYKELSKINIKEFYTMRVGRIFPCLFLFCLVYYFLMIKHVSAFTPSDPRLFFRSLMALIELQYNYFYLWGGNAPGMYYFAPLWSVSIEECFYLIFPILCFFCLKNRITCIVFCLIAIYGFFYRDGFGDFYMFGGEADVLSMGCLAALLANYLKNRAYEFSFLFLSAMIVLGFITTILVFIFAPARETTDWSLSVIGIAISLYLLSASLLSKTYISYPNQTVKGILKRSRIIFNPLSFIGKMSLQLYVFHEMFLVLLPQHCKNYAIIIVLAFAFVLEKIYLKPANDFIRKLYSTKSPSTPARAEELEPAFLLRPKSAN